MEGLIIFLWGAYPLSATRETGYFMIGNFWGDVYFLFRGTRMPGSDRALNPMTPKRES